METEYSLFFFIFFFFFSDFYMKNTAGKVFGTKIAVTSFCFQYNLKKKYISHQKLLQQNIFWFIVKYYFKPLQIIILI